METSDKYIVMHAEDSFAPLFWDEHDHGIGDYKSIEFEDDVELQLSDLPGLEEWYLQADKYDPYTAVTTFTTEGMEDWINKGYEYAKKLRTILPKDIELYYGFWHQFGDGRWRFCRAYINCDYKRS